MSEELYKEFEPHQASDWAAQVARDLKGKGSASDFNWQLTDNQTINPFSIAERPTFIPSETFDSWHIGEEILVGNNILAANQLLLEALASGADAPQLVLEEDFNPNHLEALLQNVLLEYIHVHFVYVATDAKNIVKLLQHFYDLLVKKNLPLRRVAGSFELALSAGDSLFLHPDLLFWTAEHLPSFRIVVLNGQPAHRGVASASQELADVLKQGNDCLAHLTALGWKAKNVNQLFAFAMSVGTSYFVEIAKFRALRLLWGNLLAAYEVQNLDTLPPIYARFATLSFDENENTNRIRATTMAMSAVLGGADTLTVLPADKRGDTAFARRIARNVQHLLKMESYLDRVKDPASGSFYIEQLTEKLAEEAWAIFQKN